MHTYMGGKSKWFQISLTYPAVTATKDSAPPSIEHILALHTVTHAQENMSGTMNESNYYEADHKSQQPSKTFFRSSTVSKSEIKHEFICLSFMTKGHVGEKVESPLTKWLSTQELQIVKAFESIFED